MRAGRAAFPMVALLLGLPMLGGCEMVDRITGRAPTAEPPAAAVQDSARAAEPDAAPDTLAAAPPVAPTDPESLLKLSDSEVTARLGPPDLLRRDGLVEVRQYRNADCTLDLFLYPDKSADLAVRYAELRGAGLDARGRQLCLGEMLHQRAVTGQAGPAPAATRG